MPLYRDQGIVLRTHKLGEADRIVTVFLRDRGITRLVAKGVRRTTSKFGARLEPFMLVDVQCFEGRSLDTVTQAETLATYGATISSDYEMFEVANIIGETAEKLCHEDGGRAQYHLLHGALRALARRDIAPPLVRTSYLLRAVALAGWAAGFHECVTCSANGPHTRLSIPAGGVLCETCSLPGTLRANPESVRLLGALISGDWSESTGASDRAIVESGSFATAYTQWHLERGLRSVAATASSRHR